VEGESFLARDRSIRARWTLKELFHDSDLSRAASAGLRVFGAPTANLRSEF
jgi:hypothetical protein